MAKAAIRIAMASAVLGLWTRRRGGLEFTREAREFTGEEFAAQFSSGMAAAVAFAAIVTDPALVVQVQDEDGWRDISPREVDDLHVFLEAETARVNSGDPDDEAEKAKLAAAAAEDKAKAEAEAAAAAEAEAKAKAEAEAAAAAKADGKADTKPSGRNTKG